VIAAERKGVASLVVVVEIVGAQDVDVGEGPSLETGRKWT